MLGDDVPFFFPILLAFLVLWIMPQKVEKFGQQCGKVAQCGKTLLSIHTFTDGCLHDF